MKIIPQFEIWIPFIGSILSNELAEPFRGQSLTFSPTPKWFSQDDVVNTQQVITAVSLQKTFQKVLNKALLHDASADVIPTHILMVGKGKYNEKVVDQDYSSLVPEFESRDYKFPEILYLDVSDDSVQKRLIEISTFSENKKDDLINLLTEVDSIGDNEPEPEKVTRKRRVKTTE